MNAFRILLIIIFMSLTVYTVIVGIHHGWNLLPIFFRDIGSMTWPGQFNSDFLGFLILSGSWLSWRHHFTPKGLFLGLCGFFGGIMFLAPYLLYVSLQANGNMNAILLGNQRAAE